MKTSLKWFGGTLIFSALVFQAFAGSKLKSETPASSFNEVWEVVVGAPKLDTTAATPNQIQNDVSKYGTDAKPTLPQFSGGLDALGSLISGALKEAASRTIHNRDDYHDYFKKLVHANGICFNGVWEITGNSNYSGYFAPGKKGLIIGRISAASPQTTNDKDRAFGFAAKIFPTLDANEPVKTANFFTVDNLNGTPARQFSDVALTNEPPADLSGVLNPIKFVNQVFEAVDVHPSFRPLYPISRAGEPAGSKPVTPKWIRIRLADEQQKIDFDISDFRNELLQYQNGIVFSIEVSDTTKDRLSNAGWNRIGEIRTSPMVTTFGCDRRLHFAHPTFNDPEGN